MCIVNYGNRLLTFLIVLTIAVECSRKYDINDEAHKLYQTDLYSVLQKFRRTPEYQKILEEKAYTQILFRYKMKLQARLAEVFELDKLKQAAAQGSTPPKSCFRMGLNYRKNEEQEPEKDPGIARLDQYNKFYGKLTLTERNQMKNLGFEYAGHVIHTLIKAMGPDNDHIMKSTLQTYDNDEDDKKKKTEPTTTEHAVVHKVTSTTEKIEEIPIETAKPEKRAHDEDDDNQTSEQPTKKEKKSSKQLTLTEPTQVY